MRKFCTPRPLQLLQVGCAFAVTPYPLHGLHTPSAVKSTCLDTPCAASMKLKCKSIVTSAPFTGFIFFVRDFLAFAEKNEPSLSCAEEEEDEVDVRLRFEVEPVELEVAAALRRRAEEERL